LVAKRDRLAAVEAVAHRPETLPDRARAAPGAALDTQVSEPEPGELLRQRRLEVTRLRVGGLSHDHTVALTQSAFSSRRRELWIRLRTSAVRSRAVSSSLPTLAPIRIPPG